MNTNYLWVQEVAARKELAYGKMPGAVNSGDLFTKPLGQADIEAHCDRMSTEFARGKNEQGYSIAFMGARPPDEMLNKELMKKMGLKGHYRAWTRTDCEATTTKTTMRGGPAWNTVVARITADALTGKVIQAERVEEICRNKEHVLVQGGPRPICTMLLYRPAVDTAHAENANSGGSGSGSSTCNITEMSPPLNSC